MDATKISKVGLIGGSRKMTAVYWMTPFAAALTIIFGYLDTPQALVDQFWNWFTIAAGGYLGGQSVVDAVKAGVEAVTNRRANTNPGQQPAE
jgi:uncharacterized membrane protein